MAGWPFLYLLHCWQCLVYFCFYITQEKISLMIRIYRFIFFLLIIITSFSALSMPSETSISLTHFDKFLHFSAFLVLSIFLDLSSIDPLLKKKTLIFLLIAYALSIEVIQYFLPYRDAEFLDFLFDLLGILVYLMFAPKFKKGQQIWDIYFFYSYLCHS